jgi:predicted phage baseplate assembly protein
VRNFGAVPPKGAIVRVRSYRCGGGRLGNVSPGAIAVLKSNIPYVASVTNRLGAAGGVDGETLDEAKVRGPIVLRTRSRAVTIQDYEILAREAAPAIARVSAVPAGDGADAGWVRVLVVPARRNEASGPLGFQELVPEDEELASIAEYLDERRVIGSRVVVEPPFYQGLTVVARLRPRPRFSETRLERDAVAALHAYFDPITGGPDGHGWPFGRPVQVGEVYAVLQAIPATELVEDARLFAADPVTGVRGPATSRVDIPRHGLVFSYQHQVRVERE